MDPRLGVDMYTRKLPPSEGMETTVTFVFEAFTEEIHQDPATGIQSLVESNPMDSSPFIINFSIGSTSHSHIRDLLFDRLMNHPQLSHNLASYIAPAASDLGFGINGFEINLLLTLTYQTVSSLAFSSQSLLRRLVCQGTIDGEEELKKLKVEAQPCSICLEDLSASKTGGVPTRMPCSHVFHHLCLLQWFRRKTTCPMCRRAVSE